MIIINKANQRKQFGHGNFQVNVVFPGINTNNDIGLLNLGRFDHAVLKPSAFIGMHKHKNDEILSLIKRGTMLHKDSTGKIVPISKNHLMMMNAGSGIYHEESIPSNKYNEEVEMLQIFIRPAIANETPIVQFAEISDGELNQWRCVAGDENDTAPLQIRSEIFIYDIITSGDEQNIAVPRSPFPHSTFLIYVFEGCITTHENYVLTKGDSIILNDEDTNTFLSSDKTTLVGFVMNSKAKFTLDGMFSGETKM